jgi:hypothetical protein
VPDVRHALGRPQRTLRGGRAHQAARGPTPRAGHARQHPLPVSQPSRTLRPRWRRERGRPVASGRGAKARSRSATSSQRRASPLPTRALPNQGPEQSCTAAHPDEPSPRRRGVAQLGTRRAHNPKAASSNYARKGPSREFAPFFRRWHHALR